MEQKVDIKENYIYELDNKLLEILLKDHSSNKNIIWATDNYTIRGKGYYPYDNISLKSITGRNGLVIKPRVKKSKKEQNKRIKDKAEVFTPSWICNAQNNLIDEAWFGRKNIFNIENQEHKSWEVINEKIIFPEGKTWQDYVKENRLEISCGEAPYLASRYDTVTGEWLEPNARIGLLDRKLRIINENVDNEKDWYVWAVIAYKSIYGFEWQGDSLLIARENLLFTFNEDVEHAMKREMYEKTGLKNINFSFFKVYSNPTRSPLMRMIAITYLGVIDCKKVKIIKETAKTSDADWFQIDRIPELGYDHKEILLDAINNLKQKIFESQILKGLFSETFTIPQLYNAYSSILDKKIDRRNFRKKLLNDGIIRDTGQVQINEGKKSAKLYAFV